MGNLHRIIRAGVWPCAGLLMLVLTQNIAAEDAPQESAGLNVDAIDMLSLAAQIPQMEGYVLRVRTVTMEPGAVVAHHDHAQRPIAVYVVSGEFTEIPDDGPEITRGPGTQWVEDASMIHWGANRGDVPTVLVAVDLVPEE